MLTNLYTVLNTADPRARREYIYYLGLNILSALFYSGATFSLLYFMEGLLRGEPLRSLLPLLILLLCVAAAWGIEIVNAHVGLRLGIDIMHSMHRGVPRALITWNSTRLSEEKIARLRYMISTGATEATSALVLVLSPLLSSSAYIVLTGLIFLWIQPVIGAIILLSALLSIGSIKLSERAEERSMRAYDSAQEQLENRLYEFAWAQPTLRINPSARRNLCEKSIDEAHRGTMALVRHQLPMQGLSFIMRCLVLAACSVSIYLSWWADIYDAPRAVALLLVLFRVLESLELIGISMGAVSKLRTVLGECVELEHTPEYSPVNNRGMHKTTAPALYCDNLSYIYPDGTPGCLDITLNCKPGKLTVILGPSGSGKSTLLNLCAGVLESESGTISINGQAQSPEELSSMVSYASQDPHVKSGTIRDNLMSINPGLNETQVAQILRASGLEKYVQDSEHGVDTKVGEWGSQLSGGQLQRLGLARALAKDSSVLLLDEITSSLDNATEQQVIKTLSSYRGRYTMVAITHRLALAYAADTIYYMEKGKIREISDAERIELYSGWRVCLRSPA